MPQRPHKTPLDRANSFLHEAERGIKTDPDNGNYWLHKMKEAEDELDRIAGEMMKGPERRSAPAPSFWSTPGGSEAHADAHAEHEGIERYLDVLGAGRGRGGPFRRNAGPSAT